MGKKLRQKLRFLSFSAFSALLKIIRIRLKIDFNHKRDFYEQGNSIWKCNIFQIVIMRKSDSSLSKQSSKDEVFVNKLQSHISGSFPWQNFSFDSDLDLYLDSRILTMKSNIVAQDYRQRHSEINLHITFPPGMTHSKNLDFITFQWLSFVSERVWGEKREKFRKWIP